MIGLNHDFLLILREENPYYHWEHYLHHPSSILIHDELLWYMHDTIKWIPSYNPSRKHTFKGLCMYGITEIREDGAEVAEKVFSLWAELFACGPKVLKLTGGFTWESENDSIKDGYERIVPNTAQYEKLIVNRNQLVDKLQTLASYARRIRDSNGAYYIFHSGL